MKPTGRPAVGPSISTRFSENQLIRIDGAAAREGQSRAEWLRGAADIALGEPLEIENFPMEAFTQATHTPSFDGDGRFDDLFLTMTEGGWGLDQVDQDIRMRRTDTAYVRLSRGGLSTPTGPEVSALLRPLAPWIERVILDCEVEDGQLNLGHDAQHSLAHINHVVDSAKADLDTIDDATTHLTDAIGGEHISELTDEEIEALVSKETADLRDATGWWIDQRAAVDELRGAWGYPE